MVRVGNNTSATLILSMEAPQECMLSPLLYSLLTHDCMARHNSNTILNFADTTVVVLTTDNDDTAYREEVRDLTVWCKDKNISLNVIKTREMIVNYRKRSAEHTPILIDGAVLEQVESFKFLGVHITNKHPAIQDLYTRRCQRKSLKMVKDSSHLDIVCKALLLLFTAAL
jgi:hypothetical protein